MLEVTLGFNAHQSNRGAIDMTYRIAGIEPGEFAELFAMDDAQLGAHRAVRVVAQADQGWPCRVTLEDAKAGENLILINHVSHDVATPFRASHAIYVREMANGAALYIDETPPVFATRILSLRAFDKDGMLLDAALAKPGEADAGIRTMLHNPTIAYIHVHNAVPGCFAAKVERSA
jgi:Protein of unknown function (DUF1203)